MNRDPGLQPERTALAWKRTSLLMAANAVLIVRAGVHAQHGILLTLGIVAGLTAAGLHGCGSWRVHRLQARAGAPPSWLLALTSTAVVLASAAAVLGLALGP